MSLSPSLRALAGRALPSTLSTHLVPLRNYTSILSPYQSLAASASSSKTLSLFGHQTYRSYAKKSKAAKRSSAPVDRDLDDAASNEPPSKGKNTKNGKGKSKSLSQDSTDSGESDAVNGEEGLSEEDLDDRLVSSKVKPKMEKTWEWCKGVVYEGVERGKGRISPALLDSIRVQLPGDDSSQSLESVASITTKQGALWVQVWDSDALKAVESALHKANLPGMSPQKFDASTLKIPVSRPTQEHRTTIMKGLQDAVETAKQQFRLSRTDGMKGLKSKDGKNSVAGKEIQKMTDKYSKDVDGLIHDAKRELAKV